MIKKKILLTTTAAMLAMGSSSALAARIQGLSGSLASIENALEHAIERTESFYAAEVGDITPRAENYPFVQANESSYVQYLTMGEDYTINITFPSLSVAGSINNAEETPNTVAFEHDLASGLFGKQIVLTPVYSSGDELITRWTCITNADDGFALFAGGQSANNADTNSAQSKGVPSIIQEYVPKTSPLAGCIYVSGPLHTKTDTLLDL